MKFLISVIVAVLLTASAVASPLSLVNPLQSRTDTDDSTALGNPLSGPDPLHLHGGIHQYSDNWSGAYLVGNGFDVVSAYLIVPEVTIPTNGLNNGSYCASAWVGIDGATCDLAILQAGINFCVSGGKPVYSAWYEWWPDYSHKFSESELPIFAGEVIKITVNATTNSTGTATIDNVSNGKSVTHEFTGKLQGDLCQINAEWVVEDFSMGDMLVPFANFGSVTFSGAEATSGGKTVGPADAVLIDIKSYGEIITSSSVTNDSVTINHL